MSAYTREFIRELRDGFTGSAKLWRVSPPLKYGYSEDKQETEYVVSSATVAMFTGPETYIFPANAEGEIVSWSELPGSYRGGLDHDVAMSALAEDWT